MKLEDNRSRKVRLAREAPLLAVVVLYWLNGIGLIGTDGVGVFHGLIRGTLWPVGAVLAGVGLVFFRRDVEAAGHVLLIAGTLIHLLLSLVEYEDFGSFLAPLVFALAIGARLWYLIRGHIDVIVTVERGEL